MKAAFSALNIALLLFITFCFTSVNAEIKVEPFGIAVSFDEEGEEIIELILSNEGNEDVTFEISFEEQVEEEQRFRGPRRDDLGDVIREIDIDDGLWAGLAWDGELMWGVDYEGRRMFGVTLDGDVDEQVQLDGNYSGMCWDGEAFWFGFL